MIAISDYLTFSAILFGISIAGIFINRKKLNSFANVYRINVTCHKY
jgi:NADH:ubiquinone oxidoreductase subunit K